MKESATEKQIAFRISTVSIIVNLLLALLKLVAGIVGKSGAMISDAIHSASDIVSTIVVIIGIEFASKESDKEHQYGHERIECVASVLLAILLFLTGVGIGADGVNKILAGNYNTLAIPTIFPLVVAFISIGVKEWMYWYTRSGAKRIKSGAMMADAWHHRSDALSSIGAFVGILGARMGFPVCDAIASVVICIFIAKAAYDIFKDAMDKMIDKSCDENTNKQIECVTLSVEGVVKLDSLQTRLFGSRMYVDIEIAADGTISLYQAHEIAEEVHRKIEQEFPTVKHCMVHVNPI